MVEYNQLGADAYIAQNYNAAFKYWTLAANEQNDSNGQMNLANCYLNGTGTTQDLEKAIRWYKTAANNGAIKALFMCGYVYDIIGNYSEAFSWFMKAAEHNDSDAEYNIGFYYLNGIFCEKSQDKAIYWFLKAAEHGDLEAQKLIAKYYFVDLNNEETALYWYIKAAEQGDKESIDFLAHTFNVDRKDTDNFLKWSKIAAEGGNADSQCNLGEYYFSIGDYKTGLYWLEISAKNGSKQALLHIGRSYYFGTHLKQDYAKAYTIFNDLSSCGHSIIEADALEILAWTYYNGFGVNIDYKIAYNYVMQAYDKRGWLSSSSNHLLGLCYYWGNGVTKNLEEAFRYLTKAADLGNCQAEFLIGESYLYGTYVNTDYTKAIQIFNKLVNCSDIIAKAHSQSSLGWCYYFGCGVSKDYIKAYRYLIQAETILGANLDSNSAYALGLCYYNGHGINKDYKKALCCFRDYYQNYSNPLCIYGMGRCYYLGHGIEKDIDKGTQLLTIASEKGIKQASELLKNKYCLDGDFPTTQSIMGEIAGSIVKSLVIKIIGGINND